MRSEKCGKNGAGDKLDFGNADRMIRLNELINYVCRDDNKWYHLLDDNCQNFAKLVFGWITGRNV